MGNVLAETEHATTEPPDDGSEGPDEAAGPASVAPASADPGIHRLRDLSRRDRGIAAAFAVALLLAPILSFLHYAPDWIPSGDPALMGLRSLDVGGSRTPLIGQPSLSSIYVEDYAVNHLGPTHFYLMAPFVRLFGASVGMLLTSVLITGGSILVAAWAAFRQLGRAGGVLAAALLGAITFTAGAASLVNPVSSSIARYPFLCSVVLLWCLVGGDLRLLPLTTAMVSFTGQQHLSTLPALLLVTVVAVTWLVVRSVRQGWWSAGGPRRSTGRWFAGSALLGLVLWSPVLLQQAVGNSPNLSALVGFTTHDERPTLGLDTSVRQVAHVIGLPPMLGQTQLEGVWLFREVSPVTWLTAALAVVVLVTVGWRWRRTQPRVAATVVMAGALAVAGLYSGASVPEGPEQHRLVFYHWSFGLVFFTMLGLGLVALTVGRRVVAGTDTGWTRGLAVAAALLVVGVPALVNPSLDRQSNKLVATNAPINRDALDQLTADILGHRDQLEGNVVVMADEYGQAWYAGLHEALALELNEHGYRVQHALYDGEFVDDERLARRPTVERGIVVTLDTVEGEEELELRGSSTPPEPIAEVRIAEEFDGDAYEERFLPFLKRPLRVRVYLLDRDDLLDWAKYRDFLPR